MKSHFKNWQMNFNSVTILFTTKSILMKKFITLLIMSVAVIGCSKQNDATQHISRTAEAVLFNKEAGGETIVLENATAVIDVFEDNRMTVHIKNQNGKEEYRFTLNDVSFESGKVDIDGTYDFKNMYDIDFIRSLNTSEEYFRYFPDFKGHTLILCSKYGIRSVNLD